MNRYFIYARKSTDSEDKQVLSIEAQLTELREYAKREGLVVVDELFEAKTAKEPGRSVFNEMMRRLERGQANAILAWHPDRLARNSMDGGKVIYLTDIDKLVNLRFPTYKFENTAQGKFMLSIIFGQSKYFVDNLAENVQRGFRQKLRRGEYPGFAPLGYKNNTSNHSIEVVPEIAEKVRRLFELYATGRYSMAEIRKLAAASGLASRRKHRPLAKSNIERMLKNPFYYGAFEFKDELYEGNHPPIITKELFDRAQAALKLRSKPRKNAPHYHAFRGFIRCSQCDGMITSELQKQRYIYYRCTKKRGKCSQPYLREVLLTQEINKAIESVAISKGLQAFLLGKIAQEASSGSFSPTPAITNRLAELEQKLDTLLEGYINRVISEDDYKRKKSLLLNKRLELKERLATSNRKGKVWLELARNFVSSAGQASYIANQGSLEEKREFVKKIGSNFRLSGKKFKFSLCFPYSFLAENRGNIKTGG
ncbi:MAG: recombinase family protein [Candidatus Omnitrophota bacterium]